MRSSRLMIGVLLVLGFVLPALASYQNPFPVQGQSPGFQHTPNLRVDDIPPGLGLSGQRPFRSGSTIGNVDGNPGNGNELVVVGRDSRLYVYSSEGVLRWQRDIIPGCTGVSAGDTKVGSTPAIGELYGDGTPYIVVGYGTIQNTSCAGGVRAFRGTDGASVWNFIIPALPVNDNLDGVVSSPALGDTDGDGNLEVAFGAFDRNVYFLEHDGTLRWKYAAFDTVWSSPALANIDDDPRLEMIIGTDITANGGLGTINGGYVYAFDTNLSGSINFGTGFIWRQSYNQTIYSSPLVTDLERDGTLEVVIGSGCFYNNHVNAGRWVKILDARTGAEEQTLNANSCSNASPAVGDIDDDGILEIVSIFNGVPKFSLPNGTPTGQYNNPFSWVQAWDHTNPTPKWTTIPVDSMGNHEPAADDIRSPLIADLDGNGSLEVALSYSFDVVVLNGKTGAQLTCKGQPGNLTACGSTRSLFAWMPITNVPVIGQLDNDGDLEIAVGGQHAGSDYQGTPNGYMYAWSNFAGLLGSPVGNQPPYSAPWPMFRGNPQHTGYLRNARFNAPTSVSALMLPGTSRTMQLVLRSSDNGAFSWMLNETSDPNNRVSLGQTSGSINSGEVAIPLTVDANNSAPDTYTATLELTGNGFPPVTITITIVTAETLYQNMVPLLKK